MRLTERHPNGAKSGEGFYHYAEGDTEGFLAQRDRVLLGFLDVLRHERDSSGG